MLENILESEFPSLILAFLLLSPKRAFSKTEIVARTGVVPTKFDVGMAELLDQKYVKAVRRGDAVLYLLDSSNKLLNEVEKDLVKNYKPLEDEFTSVVRKLGDIKGAFLSGVLVGRVDLPVDLLIVGQVDEKKFADFLEKTKKLMEQDINYSVMSVDDFKVRKNTFDRFIKDIFDYPHLVLFDNTQKKK